MSVLKVMSTPLRARPLSVASLEMGLYIRSMSRSPSAHGLSGTAQVNPVGPTLSELKLKVVVPFTSMKSMA